MTQSLKFTIRGDGADTQVAEQLARIREIAKVSPLHLYNNAEISSKVHHKQLEFHAIKCPRMGTKALIAGNRSGKTVACTVDDIIQLCPAEDLPPHLREYKKFDSPCHIWVGAPKVANHYSTSIPLFRKWLPKAQLREGNFDKSYSKQHNQLTLECGSTVTFKTYDQDIDSWASAEVHRIRWDEESRNANGREMRQEARQRILSTGGDEVIGMTPLLGLGTWVFEEVYERRHEDGIYVLSMSMGDNPWNSKEDIEKNLAGYTDEERRARENGEFVHFGGVFFPEFKTELHETTIKAAKDIAEQEIVVSIDPGLVHTGVVWTAWDSDNSGVIFEELFTDRTDVAEISQHIKNVNKAWGLKSIPTYIIDPSYRNLQTEIHADAVQSNYAREGIYVAPGNNDRRAGILEIKKRLQAKDPKGEPAPTLLFADRCPRLMQQVERYRRNPDASDEWQAVPQVGNTRFDLVDAMRYAVMSRTWMMPEEGQYVPPTYEYGFEPPYNERDFQIDAPPMGDQS